MNLAEFAAAAEALAARAEADLAIEVARAGARELLAAMFVATPVRSGALRASEAIHSVSGGGALAVAEVGPDIIYDRFRNDGGTIRVKHARVLTDGSSFFGKQVTQAGSHYMERAEDEARPLVEAAGQVIVDEFVRL